MTATQNLPTGDAAEIAKFDAQAHRYWDPTGEFKPLHLLNPIRAAFVTQRVPLADRSLLDVGCGGGLLSEAMARAGAKVTGSDLAPGMIDAARLHAAASQLDIEYRLQDAAELAAEGVRYDVVCCMEMLEHLSDFTPFITTLARLVKPGGSLFVSTLNRTPRAFALGIVTAEYLLRLLPKGTHEYARFIRPSELAEAGRAAGLETAAIAGLAYEPWPSRAYLSQDVSINYIAQLKHS